MAAVFDKKAPNWPRDDWSVARLERHIEHGELGEVPATALRGRPRYLVTYMNSQTQGRIRSATVVSITNQSRAVNLVTVSFFQGFGSTAVGVASFAIPPQLTVDFGSRDLPGELTVVNALPSPAQLTFDEGRAVVSSDLPEIGVSARVYYTSGDADEQLHAITDCGVVAFGAGNNGD